MTRMLAAGDLVRIARTNPPGHRRTPFYIRGKLGVVSQLTDKFPAAVLDQLDGIRVIANVAVGFDNIDVPAATRRKILVTNTPDVLTDTTADFAFALLMAAARRVVEDVRRSAAR